MKSILLWVGVSLILPGLVHWARHSRNRLKWVCGLALMMTVWAFLVHLPYLFVQSLVTVCLTFAATRLDVKPAQTTAAEAVSTLSIFCALLIPGLWEVHHRRQMRYEFALKSLADRLEYERKSAQENRIAPYLAATLEPGVEMHLWENEHQNFLLWRPRLLRELHNPSDDFLVMIRGFGKSKIRPLRPDYFALLPYSKIHQPQPLNERFVDDWGFVAEDELFNFSIDDEPLTRPTDKQLRALHNAALADFLNPERMGYVRDIDHVAGFQSHGFTRIPQMPSDEVGKSANWAVHRIDLISILRFASPAVYVTDQLPQLDDLNMAEFRSVSSFENQAIEKLRRYDDFVAEFDEDQIQVVGAIRAASECLKCHQVSRGELLGAFSYRLVPVR